jgi:hypothetical protein
VVNAKPGRFIPGKEYPLPSRLDGPHSRSGSMRKMINVRKTWMDEVTWETGVNFYCLS